MDSRLVAASGELLLEEFLGGETCNPAGIAPFFVGTFCLNSSKQFDVMLICAGACDRSFDLSIKNCWASGSGSVQTGPLPISTTVSMVKSAVRIGT